MKLMIKKLLFYILIFFIIQKITANVTITKKCDFPFAVPLNEDEIERLNNGSIIHNGLHYQPHNIINVNNTLRGCVCDVSNKPCILKCCAHDEVLIHTSENTKCGKINKSTLFPQPKHHQLADELKIVKNLSHHFSVFTNDKICNGNGRALFLEPDLYDDDDFILHANGSLQTWDRIFHQSQYCIDWQENLINISVAVCDDDADGDEDDDEDYTSEPLYGMMLSIPFLLATLFVYAVIPELRTLYGLTLMCYVGCLATAYCFLIVGVLFLYHGDVLCTIIEIRDSTEF